MSNEISQQTISVDPTQSGDGADNTDTKPTSTQSTNNISMADTTEPNSVTLISGTANLFRQCTAKGYEDIKSEQSPDGYFLTNSTESYRGMQQVRYEIEDTNPLFYPDILNDGELKHERLNGIDILIANDYDAVEKISDYEDAGTIDTDTQSLIFTPLLTINTDINNLETTLEGLEEYQAALSVDELTGDYTHFSTNIESGYCKEWGELTVRGFGHTDTTTPNTFLAATITVDGTVNNTEIDLGNIGLKAIENIGPSRAGTLKSNGYTTREDVADASLSELTGIDGFGKKTAEKISQSATALAENTIIPTSDSPVPGSDPIFIDIETDGLNPTAVWLIGVQDGVTGNYMSFIETDPENAGEAVETFMMWFKTNGQNRTVMAWNGWNFDFPVLREHIQKHCPQYADTWKRASKRDPLRWARDLDNAILPGRTNKLEHVAEALGWDGHTTGLSGAEVARQYQRWMDTQDPDDALDWEQHKQYCEADVKALAFIYEHLEDASRIDGSQAAGRDIEEETDQGSLLDSY